MKFIFIISFFLIQSQILSASSNSSQENRKFYEDRAEFLKKEIKEIKEKRKSNKNVNGSIVETLSGKIYTRIGIQTQKEIDNLTIQDCKIDGGIDCLVRFRSLKKNPKYNRLAKYDKSKKTLKVLNQYLTSKKVYSTKGIDILIAEKDFNNKDDFNCTKAKSNYREILNTLRKEIEIYPTSFLKNSGLLELFTASNTFLSLSLSIGNRDGFGFLPNNSITLSPNTPLLLRTSRSSL